MWWHCVNYRNKQIDPRSVCYNVTYSVSLCTLFYATTRFDAKETRECHAIAPIFSCCSEYKQTDLRLYATMWFMLCRNTPYSLLQLALMLRKPESVMPSRPFFHAVASILFLKTIWKLYDMVLFICAMMCLHFLE